MKAIYFTSLLLLCMTIASVAIELPTYALTPTQPSFCENNEKRLENREACKGHAFGQLLPYPGNCSQFLVCNCVYPTVVACPCGLWYNPVIKACDWPRNVPSCDDTEITSTATTITTTPQSSWPTESTTQSASCDLPPGLTVNSCQNCADGTLQRYPYNCNAYINCTQGCSILNYCIPGKVFNVLLKICDTPDTAKCIELDLPTTTEASTITTMMTTQTTEQITTSTEAVTHTTLPDCEPLLGVSPEICYFTEEYGFLRRYPYDCKAYINCTSFCPQLDYCDSGKVFNDILGICDTPSDEYCKEEPFPTTTALTTITPIITTTPAATLPPDFNNEICKDKPSGTLLPYEKDCASFIACVHDHPILQECPAGWLFNPDLLICDESKDVNCFDGKTTIQPTTTTPIYESCVNQPYGVSFPDVNNCQQYYFCYGNGTSSILHCPFDNWYNPDTGNCGPEVSPEACRLTTSTTTTTTKATPPKNVCENQPASKTFPDKTNCGQYIYCLGGGDSMVLQCPPNNYFNPATGNCGPGVSDTACREDVTTTTVSPTTTTTTISISTTTQTPPYEHICANSSNGELIPYPESCTKYIVCAKLAPIALSCPNNWQFNPATKCCDLPDNVKCGHGEGTTTVAPPSNVCQGREKGVTLPYKNNCRFYIECLGADLWMLNSCAWGEYYDASTHKCSADVSSDACLADITTPLPSTEVTTPIPETTTVGPKHKNICYGIPSGEMIPYPNNCTKYIICQSPIPVGYECCAGLEFSAEQQKCVEPGEANCSIKTTISTTERTTTTEDGSGSTTGPDCKNAEPGATFPFRPDCSKYIICVSGLPQIVPCMPNTYYNPDLRRCDCYTSPTACFGESTTEMTTPSTVVTKPTDNTSANTPTPENTPTPIETTPTTQSTPSTENPNGPCDGEPDGMLVPYPYNCSKYIICLSPIPIGYDCPHGLEFSSDLRQCVSPKDSNCGWTTVTTVTPTTSPLTTTTSPEKQPDCSKAENGAVFPYPEDCSQYIICMNGDKMIVKCMPDTYFDPVKGSCDGHTSETACRETGSTETTKTTVPQTTVTETTPTTETTSTTTETTPTTTETTPTTTETTSSTSTVASTTLDPNTQNVCCGKQLGTIVAYPGACDRFVCCDYPVPIVKHCAGNDIFDMSLSQCVPWHQGQCQNYQLHDD